MIENDWPPVGKDPPRSPLTTPKRLNCMEWRSQVSFRAAFEIKGECACGGQRRHPCSPDLRLGAKRTAIW